MSEYTFETVDVPRGAFISWGPYVGQSVVGRVLDFDPSGGTDFNDKPCPQLQVELIEPCKSISKDLEVTDFAKGELVMLNCGQTSLKRAVKVAALESGDIVKIELVNLVKVDKGTVKEFGIKVARGAGKGMPSVHTSTAAQPVSAPVGNPFGGQAAAANPFGGQVAQPSANPFA